jgi:hypothetical protein
MAVKELNIHFGALADPIAKQVKSQGFKFNGKQMLIFQEQSEAILRLRFAGLLTDSMMDKVHSKLFAHIKEHIKGMMKPVKA